MLLNCGVGEDSFDSPLDCKEIQPVYPKGSVLAIHWKDWCWSWNSNTLATWWKELTHLKRPWCGEGLRAGGEEERGWNGWMASLTQWTWVWVNPRSWWWTGKPSLACCNPQGPKESDITEKLDWTTLMGGRSSKSLFPIWITNCLRIIYWKIHSFPHLFAISPLSYYVV